MSRGSRVAAVTLLLIILVAAGSASAHRLDEYLQAARIGLEPDGLFIEMDLTPGIAVAQSITAMIDRNHDGLLTEDEQRNYANEVVRALEIKVDGAAIPLRLASSSFASLPALHRGEGMIRLHARGAYRSLSSGGHQLFFRNAHFPSRGVYLANALVPESTQVAVTGQRRDAAQSELTIDYTVEAAPATPAWQVASITSVLLLVWPLMLVVRHSGVFRVTRPENTSRFVKAA